MPTLYINDTAIEDLGLIPLEVPQVLGGVPINRSTQAWPGRSGGLASPISAMEPRVLRFVADSRVTTVAARSALLDTLADQLTGLVEVRYADQPDRVMRGVARTFVAEVPIPPRWVNVAPRVTVEIECANVARWDAQPQSRVIGATPVAIPVGTLPHGGQLYLTGTSAGALSGEVRIRYRGVSGVLLGELVLTVALLAGEYAVVDFDNAAITKYSTSGTASDVYSWKTGGAWFRVAPRDAVRGLSAWGSLELSAGAGLYLFRRQWLT